jgi:hypothetical protein
MAQGVMLTGRVSFCALSLSIIAWPVLAGQASSGAQNAARSQAGGPDAVELSRQATDPSAPLMSFGFVSDFQTSFHGLDDSGFEFRFQPAVPFRAWGVSNILRVIAPYQGAGPGNEGLKSVSVLDVMILPQSWGRLVIGPVMNLEESESDKESKFSLGPAIGAVVPMSPKLNAGIFSQNLFGSDVAITQLQPVLAYQLGRAWALSAGDLQFVYDWKQGQWVQVPLGFQIGVVRPIAGQAFRFALSPQWNLKDVTGAVESRVTFLVTLLAPAK